jgi:dTDP-4-amino-4,6-dideoxygalactose transaminase
LKVLENRGCARLPYIPPGVAPNGHLFYLLCENFAQREDLIRFLEGKGIKAIFHYLPLHDSPFFKDKHDGRILPNAQRFAKTLIRLPLFFELSEADQQYVIDSVLEYFGL